MRRPHGTLSLLPQRSYFFEPGFSVIDGTFLRAANGALHWIVKDETPDPPRKFLRMGTAQTVQGPFGDLGPPFTPEGLWVEGPSGLELPGGEWLIYFEAYMEQRYGAMRSRDRGATWKDVSKHVVFPEDGTPQRVRHGKTLMVPRTLVDRIISR